MHMKRKEDNKTSYNVSLAECENKYANKKNLGLAATSRLLNLNDLFSTLINFYCYNYILFLI